MDTFNCIECGTPKKIKQSSKTNKFCSHKCYWINKKGKPKQNYTKIIFPNCDYCGKQCSKKHGKNRDGTKCDNLYCSSECYYKIHKEKIDNRECIFCKEEFVVKSHNKNNKYCNDKCRRLEAQIKVAKKHNVIAVTIDNKLYIKRCIICDSTFELNKRKSEYKLCSKECLSIHIQTNEARKEKISKAFMGENHPNYVHHPMRNKIRDKPTKEIREYTFRLFNGKCFKCGSEDSLCYDHHLPNVMGGCLTFTNSVLLCRSCNSEKNAKSPSEFYTQIELNKLSKLGINENSLFSVV